MVKNHISVDLSIEISVVDAGEEENAVTNALPPNQRFHYIIHYIVKGKGIFKSSAQQETYQLSAGDAFAVYKHDTVYYESDHNNPLHYYWIGFNGSDSEKALRYMGFSKTRQVIPLKNFEMVRNAFHEMVYSHNGRDDFSTLSTFFNCFKIIRESNLGAPPSAIISDKLLSDAISFMETNIDKNLTVENIAGHLHVDRSTFSKKFKAKFNTSPHEYFLRLKLSKAEMLLKMSDYNMSEISEVLGFTDNYIFSKVFKKYYGISPSAYRKLRSSRKKVRRG